MSDQLKIPSNIISREPTTKIEGIKDSQNPLISDTSKVIKPNDKDSMAQSKSDNSTSFNYQSISARTMRLLANNETASQALKRLLFNDDILQLMKSGSSDGIKISNFLNAFFMSLEQLPGYLNTQLNNASLFRGNFFDILQQLMTQNSGNSRITDSIMQLLKGMEAFQNRQNTTTFLINNLNNLVPYLSKQNQQDILGIIGKLHQMPQNTDQLNSLRRQILDILGNTASQNKDNQTLRNMIMQAVHNLTRLDQSDQDSLSKLFNNLLGRLQQYSKLPADQLSNLQNAFQQQLHTKATGHAVADQVLAALDDGLSGNSPLAVQLASSNILSALLLNHSVLLPLIYGFVPLQLNDDYLYSEFWAYVDEEANSSFTEAQETVKIFFTIESTVLGYFQGTLQSSGKKLSLALEAPELALPYLDDIKTYLTPAFEKLGYLLESAEVTPMVKPKKFYDVFGKKILKEAYLNVQI